MSGGPVRRSQVAPVGVRIAGTGQCVPDTRLTNADFEQMVDTSDEWIVQRTGIRERRVCDYEKGEGTRWMCTNALREALADARMDGGELDLIILATVTGEMSCPATACRVAHEVGAGTAGALDILAACSGFVYGMNMAHDMVMTGRYRSIAVIGCDAMSKAMDYTDRAVSILFGDAAGAAILRVTDDTTKGMIAGSMHADGSRWKDLYLPRYVRDLPEEADPSAFRRDVLEMRGREVYKFAVKTFGAAIEETLERAGVSAADVDMFICHQSNARMLESARERFGVPASKLPINIDRYGNCSAGSVPLLLDQLRRSEECPEGSLVMFVAFGGGLTWATSLWRL